MIYDFLKNKGILESIQDGVIIDIGSGDGSEGKIFIENGYKATFIEIKNGLDATQYEYPKNTYDIAIAKNSLPFMGNKQFDVIAAVHSTLKNGGYFYGTVFGAEDPWAKLDLITPVDFSEVLAFLNNLNFEIIWQAEEKGIGPTRKGELKNWHILKFLVKKI